MNDGLKEDIRSIVDILKQLDATELLLIENGAELLLKRKQLEEARETA